MATQRKPRSTKGKAPKSKHEDNPYLLEKTFFDQFTSACWHIYSRKNKNYSDWTNYKVICIDRTKGGANFWVSCNFMEQRFSKSYRGAVAFSSKKPSAFAAFCDAIDILNPDEWIEKTQNFSNMAQSAHG